MLFVMGCGLTSDKLLHIDLRSKLLWGRLRAKLLWGETRGKAGQVTGGRTAVCGPGCGNILVWIVLCANLLRCRVGQGLAQYAGWERAPISSPPSAFVCTVHTGPNIWIYRYILGLA